MSTHVEVAVIGAGPRGISTGHLPPARGITYFAVPQRDNEFGGAWHRNYYPDFAVVAQFRESSWFARHSPLSDYRFHTAADAAASGYHTAARNRAHCRMPMK